MPTVRSINTSALQIEAAACTWTYFAILTNFMELIPPAP